MPGLRVLLTTNALGTRGGTEVFVRDLAMALVSRGHNPVVYSTVLGDTADDLRRATVPVVTDLAALGDTPDVIHGQHHLEAMTAAMTFPSVPALYVCHGWLPWEEVPPVFPSFRRYVAVDDLCRERLVTTPELAVERVRTIYNAVDLTRFRPRAPLPARPASAVVFSNYAHDGPAVEAIRRACAARGITLAIVGAAAGAPSRAPEAILGQVRRGVRESPVRARGDGSRLCGGRRGRAWTRRICDAGEHARVAEAELRRPHDAGPCGG